MLEVRAHATLVIVYYIIPFVHVRGMDKTVYVKVKAWLSYDVIFCFFNMPGVGQSHIDNHRG